MSTAVELLGPPRANPLEGEARTARKIELNHRKNKEQDQTNNIDAATRAFRYEDAKDSFWNPESFSLLHGTPLWQGATERQRIVLNQLYWVAYYSQIISAEIATIFFNQTSAAGLYAVEDFRPVCDMLDLESAQERAHVNAFKKVSEKVEQDLFGERLFSYSMRGPYAETMVYPDSNAIKAWWKKLQLYSFSLLSSGNAFIGCQYFTIRGVRTLNGKLVQHQLSQYYMKHPEKENAPIPSKISYYHFLDESYHFNSSTIISHDVVKALPEPTAFERRVVNMALLGCQKDHASFSVLINGIFWHDPATFSTVERLLRSKVFGMSQKDAREMIRRCFTEESDGLHASYKTHRTALESYKAYVAPMEYVAAGNKEMSLMARASVERYLDTNRRAFRRYAES